MYSPTAATEIMWIFDHARRLLGLPIAILGGLGGPGATCRRVHLPAHDGHRFERQSVRSRNGGAAGVCRKFITGGPARAAVGMMIKRGLSLTARAGATIALIRRTPPFPIATGCQRRVTCRRKSFYKPSPTPRNGAPSLLVRIPLDSGGLDFRSAPRYLDLRASMTATQAGGGRRPPDRFARRRHSPMCRRRAGPRVAFIRIAPRQLASGRGAAAGDRACRKHGPVLEPGLLRQELEYPLRSSDAHLSVRMDVAPELGRPAQAAAANTCLSTALPAPMCHSVGSGWIALDPRWYEAAWLFATSRLHCPLFTFERSCSCCA